MVSIEFDWRVHAQGKISIPEVRAWYSVCPFDPAKKGILLIWTVFFARQGDLFSAAIPVYKKCKNMTHGIEYQKDLVMMNNLTATRKLEYALQMA
jgi:hypothetical protein